LRRNGPRGSAAVIDMLAMRWLKSRLVSFKVSERIGRD
jgi:hypothetical protein